MILSNAQHKPPFGVATAKTRWRDHAVLGGLLALTLAGLIGLAAATGWQESLEQIAKLGALQMAVLLGLSLVNYFARGLRWHLFATRLGLATTLRQNLRHFLGGFAMSVTPGRVGELVRMRWLRRETGWAFERTAPLVLADRASDLAAMALILAGTVLLSTGGPASAAPVAILALAAAVVVTRPALLRRLGDAAYDRLRRWPRLFVRLRRASSSLTRFSSPTALLIAATLGIAGWLAEGYAFHLLLVWIGSDIGFAKAAMIFVFATLAGGLTGAPGGLGGAEAAMVALLSLEGVPLETSVPATVIIRVTTLWFALGLGLLVFPVAERKSLKAHALET